MALAQKCVIVMVLAVLGALLQDTLAQSNTTTDAPTTAATIPTTTTATTTSTTTSTSTTTAAPSLCAGSPPAAGAWDKCTAAGTFKSVSYCYYNTNAASFVYRYDFFKCVRSSLTGGWFFYRQNCTGATPIVGGEPFNRYNPSSGKCDLPVPSA